jgi:hypothetical protein
LIRGLNMVAVLLLGLVYGAGMLGAAVFVVTAIRRHRTWNEPGLPLHELIAPTGELQDPQYLDRKRRLADEVAAARRESHATVPLMARAPWTVQKGTRSVHHG